MPYESVTEDVYIFPSTTLTEIDLDTQTHADDNPTNSEGAELFYKALEANTHVDNLRLACDGCPITNNVRALVQVLLKTPPIHIHLRDARSLSQRHPCRI